MEARDSLSDKAQLKTLPPGAQIMVIVFGILGVYGVVMAASLLGPIDYGYFGLLLFLAVITGHTKVRLVGGSSLSLITTVVLVAVMMLGLSAAVLVGVCGVIVQSAIPWRKFIPHHLVFNTGMIVLTISVANWGYYAIV